METFFKIVFTDTSSCFYKRISVDARNSREICKEILAKAQRSKKNVMVAFVCFVGWTMNDDDGLWFTKTNEPKKGLRKVSRAEYFWRAECKCHSPHVKGNLKVTKSDESSQLAFIGWNLLRRTSVNEYDTKWFLHRSVMPSFFPDVTEKFCAVGEVLYVKLKTKNLLFHNAYACVTLNRWWRGWLPFVCHSSRSEFRLSSAPEQRLPRHDRHHHHANRDTH